MKESHIDTGSNPPEDESFVRSRNIVVKNGYNNAPT